MKVDISIIVAVNSEKKSLKNALESYRIQSLKSVEVIMIDCNSTYNTAEVMQSFLYDSRFSYQRIDEDGISGARNLGIEKARGKYIAFGDPTVVFTEDLLENMLHCAEEEEADLCVAPMASFDIYGKHEFKSTRLLKIARRTSRFDTELIWNPAVTNKLFRKERINELGLKFSAFGKAREAAFSLPFAFRANCIVCSPKGAASYLTPVADDGVSEFPIEHYLDAYKFIIKKANEAFGRAIKNAKTDFLAKELKKEQTCYIDEVILKEITVLLYSYYRHFWKIDDEKIKIYANIIEELTKELSHRGLKTFQKKNKDILFEGKLISSKAEMAKNPKVTICIGKSENHGHLHKKRLLVQVSSVFNQTMPCFELLVDERLRDIFPKEYIEYPNIKFIQAGSLQEFKDIALETCSTKYIMFQDGYARLNPKILMRHYNTLSGMKRYGFSTSPITQFNGNHPTEYSFSDLAFYSDMERTRVSDDDYMFALDLFFCNKMFRTEHLRGIRFSFSDNPVLDMYELYRHSKFVKLSHRGAYLSYTEEEAVGFLKEQEKFLPSECKRLYRNYKKIYKKTIVGKKRRDSFINFLKSTKRAFINILNKMCVIMFSKLAIKDRAFFYTIRSNGKLLENANCVYQAVNGKKVVYSKMLPHGYLDTLKIKYYMLTSKVIVTDDYLKYLREVHLRDGQKVVQLWHASGAFKRFGLDAPSKLTRREEYKTHSQYTDVCVSSDYVRQFYAHAFGIEPEVVKALGSPRTDSLVNGEKVTADRAELETKHPLLKDKKVYVYLPTFREVEGERIEFDPQIDWEKLNAELNDDEVFVISRHPVMKNPFFKNAFYSRIKDYTFETTPALLSVADAVITDYSSIIFDASLLNIPLTFYCPDYDSYERDFYLDFENDLPGKIITDSEELLSTIRNSLTDTETSKGLEAFREKEMGACDGKSTERIAALIDNYLGEK